MSKLSRFHLNLGKVQVGEKNDGLPVVPDAGGESPRAFPETCVTASTGDAFRLPGQSSVLDAQLVKVFQGDAAAPHLNLATTSGKPLDPDLVIKPITKKGRLPNLLSTPIRCHTTSAQTRLC